MEHENLRNYDVAQDVGIDKYQIDDECVKQSSLYLQYSEESARAKQERDRCKNALDLVKSDVELMIRSEPEKYLNGLKVTESVISAAILQSKDVRRAMSALEKATNAVNEADAVIRALEHKKTMLEVLSHLYLSGFYATPKLSPTGVSRQRANNTEEGNNA